MNSIADHINAVIFAVVAIIILSYALYCKISDYRNRRKAIATEERESRDREMEMKGYQDGLKQAQKEPNGKPIDQPPPSTESYIIRALYTNKKGYYFLFEGLTSGEIKFYHMGHWAIDRWFAPGSEPKAHGHFAFVPVTANIMIEKPAQGPCSAEMRKWQATILRLKNVGSGKVDDPVSEVYYKNDRYVPEADFKFTSTEPTVTA